MRDIRTVQGSIFERYVEHEIDRVLQAVPDRFDFQPELLEWVDIDLRTRPIKATGRQIMGGVTSGGHSIRCNGSAINSSNFRIKVSPLGIVLLD